MTDWQYVTKPPDNPTLLVENRPDSPKLLVEKRLRAHAERLDPKHLRLLGCPIEELSREALLDGMRIAWDMLEQERKFHMTGGPVVLTGP